VRQSEEVRRNRGKWVVMPKPAADQVTQFIQGVMDRTLSPMGIEVVVDLNNEEAVEEARAEGRQIPAEIDALFPCKDSPAAAAPAPAAAPAGSGSSPGAASSSSTSSSRGAPKPLKPAQDAAAAMTGLSLGATGASSSSSPAGASSSAGRPAAATGASSSGGGGASSSSSQAAATSSTGRPAAATAAAAAGSSSSRAGCRVCGATTRQDGNTKLHQCSRCKDKGCLYCSPACQKQDWPRHKQTCTPAASA
jgi:hypothetical protein